MIMESRTKLRDDHVNKANAADVRAFEGLREELKNVKDADGTYSIQFESNGDNDARSDVTYTPNDESKTTDAVTIRFRRESSRGWHARATGKMRLIVDRESFGRYSSDAQYPQRKDGSHSYDKVIATATSRAKSGAEGADIRRETQSIENSNKAAAKPLMDKHGIDRFSSDFVVSAGGIKIRLTGLTLAQADAILAAAKATGAKIS